MKIAILGYSGAGKSTLAKRVSSSLGIPCLHLDSVYWQEGWEERDKTEALYILESFLDENISWVIDGTYQKMHFSRRIEEADMVLILMLNRWSCLCGVLKRWFIYRGRARDDMANGCPEKLDLEFIKWVLFDGRTKERETWLLELRDLYPDKAIIIRTKKDLSVFYKKYPMNP